MAKQIRAVTWPGLDLLPQIGFGLFSYFTSSLAILDIKPITDQQIQDHGETNDIPWYDFKVFRVCFTSLSEVLMAPYLNQPKPFLEF